MGSCLVGGKALWELKRYVREVIVSLGREDTHEQQEVKIQDIIQGSEKIVTKQPVIDCQVNNSGHCS